MVEDAPVAVVQVVEARDEAGENRGLDFDAAWKWTLTSYSLPRTSNPYRQIYLCQAKELLKFDEEDFV